ncbi:MAG: hypothetical protein QOD00_75 [Blastocatellia bacterium]|nr:hypothetical protein [Blastocatellia bacterium]
MVEAPPVQTPAPGATTMRGRNAVANNLALDAASSVAKPETSLSDVITGDKSDQQRLRENIKALTATAEARQLIATRGKA